jgi:hypothetical protein
MATSPDSTSLEHWLREHDRTWLKGGLDELRSHFRSDVVFVAPGMASRTVGVEDALDGYRCFLATSDILAYDTHEYHFTEGPGTVIAEYVWSMKWRSEGVEHNDQGRDVLALEVTNGQIRIFWRTQIPFT